MASRIGFRGRIGVTGPDSGTRRSAARRTCCDSRSSSRSSGGGAGTASDAHIQGGDLGIACRIVSRARWATAMSIASERARAAWTEPSTLTRMLRNIACLGEKLSMPIIGKPRLTDNLILMDAYRQAQPQPLPPLPINEDSDAFLASFDAFAQAVRRARGTASGGNGTLTLSQYALLQAL